MTRLLICFASLGFGFSTASAQSLLAWNDQNLSAVARSGVPTRCFETLREVELENLHQQVMVIVAEVSGRYQVMRITGRSGEYLIVDLGRDRRYVDQVLVPRQHPDYQIFVHRRPGQSLRLQPLTSPVCWADSIRPAYELLGCWLRVR